MGYRVFVTQELYPFTAGGIGRVIGNFLARSTPEELARTAIVCVSSDRDLAAKVDAVYPGLKCKVISERDYQAESEDGRRYPSPDAYSATHALHMRSTLVMQVLLQLELEVGRLDYVEFPDWGGVAFASCQEKKLGRGLREARLAVRLHTTDSLLSSVERRWIDVGSSSIYDLERKAIADCDLIVGQLRPVAEHVRRFYGFAREEWEPRLRIHAPHVMLDGRPIAQESVRPSLDTPITFTSKIQHCKRPDVFVRGSAEFLLKRPECTATVCLVAHAFDGDYLDQVKSLIPETLKARFQFVEGLSGNSREAFIARSVCVFPTTYESFCLAAYEASLAGALPVVNTSNPAFGSDTPWAPGVNCVGFDGTAHSLAEALETAYFGSVQAVPVRVPDDQSPWNTVAAGGPASPALTARVSAVVMHRNNAGGLIDTLDSLLATTYPLDEILVMDSASDDPVAAALLDRLEQGGSGRITVVRVPVRAAMGTLANRGIGRATGDYVLLLEAGDSIVPGFVADAAGALARHRDYSIVTSHAELVGSPDRFMINLGEASALGLHRNHYSSSCCMVRSTQAASLRFSDELEVDTWWDFHFRATSEGARYVVSSTADVSKSMVAASEDSGTTAADRIRRHDVLRTRNAQVGKVSIPLFMTEGARDPDEAVSSDEVEALRQQLHMYTHSETVFAALTLARFLEHRAPVVLRLMRGTMRRGWRAYNMLRGRR